MTKGERTIAGRLLDEAAQMFSKRTHNRTYPELFAGVSPVELKDIENGIAQWGECDPETDIGYIPDYVLMEYLSKKLLDGESEL